MRYKFISSSLLLYVQILFYWISFITVVDSLSQEVINSILQTILEKDENYQTIWKKLDLTSSINPTKSSIERVCDRILIDSNSKDEKMDHQRVVCCTPLETRIFRNVLIRDNHIHTYSLTSPETTTTPINAVKYQQVANFGLRFHHHPRQGFDASKCKSYYNGTLHVFPKVTTHNVYHAVSDNVMPLVAQMLLDSILDPEFLYLPRKYLAYDKDAKSKLGSNPGEAPHLSLIEEIMSDGSIRLSETQEVCYRRIVWGPGPHIFFVDSLQALRRKATEFIRLVAIQLIQQQSYTWPAPTTQSSQNLLKNPESGAPLKILVYTRGNSGRGRTMRNEELLVNRFMELGANVFYCCNNFESVSLTQQLFYAHEADVITGLHGAAIVHGLFMKPGAITIEWKTLYAYDSILFGIVGDSRGGVHAQVDIRKYFKPGGHHPMDQALIQRILQAIHTTRQLQKKLFEEYEARKKQDIVPCMPEGRIERIANSTLPGDFAFAAHCIPGVINHLLGPTRPVHAEMCSSTSFLHLIYQQVSKEAVNPTHCPICARFS